MGPLRTVALALAIVALLGFILLTVVGFAIDDTADCSHQDQHDCRLIHDWRRDALIGTSISLVAALTIVVVPKRRRGGSDPPTEPAADHGANMDAT